MVLQDVWWRCPVVMDNTCAAYNGEQLALVVTLESLSHSIGRPFVAHFGMPS